METPKQAALFPDMLVPDIEIAPGGLNEIVIPYDVRKAIEYWNAIPEQTTHQPGSKIYGKIVQSLERLFDGSLFAYDENGLDEYHGRKFTLEEFKQSVDNYLIACRSEAHYPKDKSIFKRISLCNWLYNYFSPHKTKSLFIKYLTPPKKITGFSKVKVDSDVCWEEFLKIYTIDMGPDMTDKAKKGVNRIFELWSKIPKQFTHTTSPGNLGQRAVVRMVMAFIPQVTREFSPNLFEQRWFWSRLNMHFVESGYLEDKYE